MKFLVDVPEAEAVGSGELSGHKPLISHLLSFGGLRDGHTQKYKPTTPNKMMGIKVGQLMPPPKSNSNPPTLPDHQKLEANGCERVVRAIKNDKAAAESSTIPSLRRLTRIIRHVA